MNTVRLRLDLSYDGAEFSGWSRQPGLRTVEGELGAALATILRRGADPADAPRVTVAGRTDAGVHALGQVAHLELSPEEWQAIASRDRRRGQKDDGPEASLRRRVNGIAGRRGDLVVREATRAPTGFDARFSALWRRYEYRLADRRGPRDPRRRGHTLWVDEALDLAAMDSASRALTGLHDFAAFCKAREGATTIRTLLDYFWTRDDEGVLIGHVRADAFCHSMVRALVGAAIAVGAGRLDQDALLAVLDGARRTGAAPVVGAQGLTLVEVGYPPDAELAARAELTRARRDPLLSD
ncbi:MAG: tRNA pseudouridine synthase A [Microcella sp.]|uniref:tRNA pseudouridine synthase A n=1 Tax=Microcella sp. TaxID=1913979 RepID=UPI00331575B9